jgi:outer membrane protein OmpA-like peptidoglycan-associated protein
MNRFKWTADLAVTRVAMAIALMATSGAVLAERNEGPLQKGGYLAPLYGYVDSQADGLDSGSQALILAGYRNGVYALEIGGVMQKIDTEAGSSADLEGGMLNALWFPFDGLPHFYGIASAGAGELMDYPVIPRNAVDNPLKRFSLTRYGGGLGYLWDFSLGRYEMAIRSEVLYVAGRRDEDPRPGGDIGAPRVFNEVAANIGLQLPLRLAPPPPPPAPVAQVVQPVADSDGDGVFDDADQCPGTPRGTEVDSVGCPLPPPPPPPPPCTDNSDGQSIALGGCDAGKTLVLRGVNFEFDRDRLTANAEMLLDEVVSELEAHPDISVEIAGHTDSKGSEAYNQNLSERRAQSVVDYLAANGVASSRLAAVGYGEAQPVADNETEEGREINRRVELIIAGRNKSAAPVVAPAVGDAAAPAADPEAAEMSPEDNPPPAARPAPSPTPNSESDELDFLLN